MIAGGIALPVSVAFSNALAEIASSALCLAFLLRIALERPHWPAGQTFACLLGLWLAVCLMSAWCVSERSLALRAWSRKTLEYALVALAMAQVARNAQRLRLMLTVVAWAGLLFALDGIIQSKLGHDLLRWRPIWASRVTGPMANPNSFATYLVMALPLQLWAMVTRPNRWQRVALAMGVVLTAWSIALTDSRMACLLFGLSLVLFAVSTRRVALVAYVVLLGVGLWRLGALSATRFFELGPGRVEGWGIAWRMFLDHPVIGIGHGTFMANYMAYLPPDPGGTWPRPQYAHNCYLQLLAEGGLIGLGAFLTLVCWVLIRAIGSLRRARMGSLSPIAGVIISLVASLISITFDTGLYSLPIALFFWSLLGWSVGGMERETTPTGS